MNFLFNALPWLTIRPFRRRMVERIARRMGATRRQAMSIARHF
ncbi:MAG: hypothetical protein V4794_19500 [Pseudomonadota bacterium]